MGLPREVYERSSRECGALVVKLMLSRGWKGSERNRYGKIDRVQRVYRPSEEKSPS